MMERSKWIWTVVGGLAFVFFGTKFIQSVRTRWNSSASTNVNTSANTISNVNSNLKNGPSGNASRITASAASSNEKGKRLEGGGASNGSFPVGSLEERLKRWDRKSEWNVRREGTSRLVRTISGGMIPALGKDTKSVEDFLYELGDSLGIPTRELGPVQQKTFDVENIYEAKQVVQGFEVHDAFVKVFSRTRDGSIYYVASELKSVRDPLLRKDFDENAAREIVSRTYAGKKIDIEIEAHNSTNGANPRIYVKDDSYSELVWVFYIKLKEPQYDRRLIFVGAQSGQVLYNESLLVH